MNNLAKARRVNKDQPQSWLNVLDIFGGNHDAMPKFEKDTSQVDKITTVVPAQKCPKGPFSKEQLDRLKAHKFPFQIEEAFDYLNNISGHESVKQNVSDRYSSNLHRKIVEIASRP